MTTKKFECISCNFSCNKKSGYDKHLLTQKHINAMKNGGNISEKTPKSYVCKCGKGYKYRQSLHIHKKTCTYIPEPEVKEEETDNVKMYICECGRQYKYDSGYYRHKKTCTYIPEPQVKQEETDNIMNEFLQTPLGVLSKHVGNQNKLVSEHTNLIEKLFQENRKLHREIEYLRGKLDETDKGFVSLARHVFLGNNHIKNEENSEIS
jgi:uncharacterized Zn-finger protein